MDAIEVEGSESIEVVAEFDGAIVDVAYVVRDEGRSGARPAYTVGCAARASLPVGVAGGLHALVTVDDGGFVLDVADGMSGTLRADGRVQPLVPGRHRLGAGARAWVRTGAVTVHVAHVAAPRRHRFARAIDWAQNVYTGGVALVASAFLLLIYAVPPDPASLSLDLVNGDRVARFVLTPPELPPPPPSPGPASERAAAGRASKGPAGTLGKETAKSRVGQLRLPGPVSREKVIAAAQAAAQNRGILGVLRAELQGGQVGSMFGRNNPLGDGADEALIGMHGSQFEDGYGHGFDEIGHERGGGGDGDKTIGSSPLGTVGFCRGAGCSEHSSSYARSAPHDLGGHAAHAPDVVPGIATVRCGEQAACLDKEIIRRVIRQHRNEVAFCYARGLDGHPELTGRVVAQFAIDVNGRVVSSAVAESSLPEASVAACIAQAVRRWEFPRSQQMSVVRYSWMLAPPR